jgi:uncharacterized RmlC-like cupin family protein
VVQRIPPGERVPADPTPGMSREQAIASGTLWSGVVTTAPGVTSGWHHHGDHETSIYVVDGQMLVEYAADAGQTVASAQAVAGDFVHVPPHVVHRESNPGDQPSFAVLSRSGTGAVTVNVDGP